MITKLNMRCFAINVNRLFGHEKGRTVKTKKTALSPTVVAAIKLARSLGYGYVAIASYFRINQGRIADVMKGRIGPDVPAADRLPPDFPARA